MAGAQTDRDDRGGRFDRPAVLCIVVAAVLAYCLCLPGDFVFDDLHSVRDNPALLSLANVPRFFVDVTTFSGLDCRLYRPVLLTSYALDAAVWGMQPLGFKLTNLLLHIVAALLIFHIARRMQVQRIAALCGACLFAVHPMASEAINTISGRSNLAMVAGLLAAVLCHLSAMRGRRIAIIGTVLFGAVAVGCKEPGMILPVLLVILEGLHWLRARAERFDFFGAALRVLPVVFLVVGYFMLRSHFVGTLANDLGRWQATGSVGSGHTRGMVTQLATMAVLLPRIVLQLIVPHGMTMDPHVPFTPDLMSAPVIGGIAVLLGLTAIGLHAPRRHPVLFFGTCLAWGAAMPWVIKPLNLPYLEHRLYGVLAGFAFVATAVFPRVVAGWQRVMVAACLFVFAFLSGARSLDFMTMEHLWSVELARNDRSRIAMAGMAVSHMEQGRLREARPLLEELVRAYPERPDARQNLTEVHLKLEAPAAARPHVRYLVEHWPRNPFYRLLDSRVLTALGVQSGEARYFDAAVDAAFHCLKIAAPKGLVYRTAAGARRQQGDLQRAIQILDRSVAHGLDHSSVLLDRSSLLLQMGEIEKARADLVRAQRQDPFNPRLMAVLQELARGRNRSSSPPR